MRPLSVGTLPGRQGVGGPRFIVGQEGEHMAELLATIESTLANQGRTLDEIVGTIQRFTVETPSWGYGNSGTRFKVFPWPGAARTLQEKLADAAEVHRVTGACPTVAIHIPWDKVADYAAVQEEAAHFGVRIGAVNPNLFQEDIYRLGSLCHFDKQVRQ